MPSKFGAELPSQRTPPRWSRQTSASFFFLVESTMVDSRLSRYSGLFQNFLSSLRRITLAFKRPEIFVPATQESKNSLPVALDNFFECSSIQRFVDNQNR